MKYVLTSEVWIQAGYLENICAQKSKVIHTAKLVGFRSSYAWFTNWIFTPRCYIFGARTRQIWFSCYLVNWYFQTLRAKLRNTEHQSKNVESCCSRTQRYRAPKRKNPFLWTRVSCDTADLICCLVATKRFYWLNNLGERRLTAGASHCTRDTMRSFSFRSWSVFCRARLSRVP